jgi:hypothetical protein
MAARSTSARVVDSAAADGNDGMNSYFRLRCCREEMQTTYAFYTGYAKSQMHAQNALPTLGLARHWVVDLRWQAQILERVISGILG